MSRGLFSYVCHHVTRITVAIGVIGLGLAGASYSAATTEITQMGQVIPATPEGDNQRAVAISGNGNRIIVGGFSFGRGSARVFEWDASQWVQVGSTLVGATAFGAAVAISADGNRIAVSAADQGDARNGRVFVYHWSGSSWDQLGATINKTEDRDMEGTSLAMSADGNHLIIGSPGATTGVDTHGAVRMWGWNGSAWTEEAHFEGSKTGFSVQFGYAVAISANGEVAVAATSSPQSSPIPSGNEGNAQVFRRQNNGTWTADTNDNITGVVNSLQVMGAVSLSGDGAVLALGYQRQDRLQVLQYDGTNWVNRGNHIETLYDAVASLSLDGNRIMVTRPWVNNDEGITRVYQWDTSQWIQVGGDIAGSAGSALGHAGAISHDGNRFIVSPYYNSSQTRVYRIMSPEPEPDPDLEPETPTNNNETVVLAPTTTIVSNPDSSVTETQSATTTRVRDLPATGSSTHTMLWFIMSATGVALTVISRRQKSPPC